MIRMNLNQLVDYMMKQGLGQTAAYFSGCANDSVTVNGWIEKDFVKRHVGEGSLWNEIQYWVTSHMNTSDNFKFTFETEAEQRQAELQTGYIDSFDCVRMVVRHPHGGEIDFPVKNRESYLKLLGFHGDSVTEVYPTVHSYDVENYL